MAELFISSVIGGKAAAVVAVAEGKWWVDSESEVDSRTPYDEEVCSLTSEYWRWRCGEPAKELSGWVVAWEAVWWWCGR